MSEGKMYTPSKEQMEESLQHYKEWEEEQEQEYLDDQAAEEAQWLWENGGEQDALEAMWDRQEQEDAKKLPYCDCNRCLGFGDVPVSECKRD